MRTILPFALLAATAAAQLTPAALLLAPPVAPVDADVIVFRVDVLDPRGVWLDQQNFFGNFDYVMEGQWMSLLADQQPTMRAERWSLPNVHGGNAWAYGQIHNPPQHLRAGSYLLAMADDTQQIFRDPSPVVPCAVPTTFSDGVVAVTCIGYGVGVGNAVFERPPFGTYTLQPCDMTGAFPYLTWDTVLPPPVTLEWEAGAHDDTCSSYRSFPLAGFVGSCGRWIVRNFATGTTHADAVDMDFVNQSLTTTGMPILPNAIAGIAMLGLEPGAPAWVDFDLDPILPGMFPRGGALRYLNLPVIWPLALVTPQIFTMQFTPGPDPTLVGQSMMLQGIMLDGLLQGDVTDVYSITFW